MKVDHSAVDEFEGLELGDVRRVARVRRTVAALQSDPAAAFPKALKTVAAREAFYRLVNNDAVTIEALLVPHAAQTIGRIAQDDERPIVAIDKTKFIFEGDGDRDGLDRLSNNKQGFEAFFALAVSATRRSHGVLGIQVLDGQGASSGNAWNEFLSKAGGELEGAKMRPIYVMDREADSYALLHELVAAQRDFVIRISFDRLVREFKDSIKEPLRVVAARSPTMVSRTVRVNRRKTAGRTTPQRLKHPPRPSRDALLSIRATEISMPRPGGPSTKGLGDQLLLNLVQVVEERPADGEVPIEWFLVTSLPIATARGVEDVVDAYRARWVIEEYFKALKTGCKYESRQLESRHALLNALGLLVPIAWRLLELRTIGEEEPEATALDVLDRDELHVLRKLARDAKLGPNPTAHEALLAVASLGGHIRQNGRPGWQTLFLGFQELLKTVDGYRFAKSEM